MLCDIGYITTYQRLCTEYIVEGIKLPALLYVLFVVISGVDIASVLLLPGKNSAQNMLITVT